MKALPILLLILAAPALAAGAPWSITGNEHVSTADLAAAASTDLGKYREHADPAFADDAAFEMTRLYHERGFPFAEVTFRRDPAGGVVFVVSEGPRAILAGIDIKGARNVSAKDLAALVEVRRDGILGPRLYVRSDLLSAARRMATWLRQQGFLRAEVRPPPPLARPSEIPERIEIRAVFRVREGPRAVLAAVHIRGTAAYSEKRLLRKLAGPLEDMIGHPYTPYTPYALQSLLVEFYGQRGRPYAAVGYSVSYREKPHRLLAEVTLSVDEGPECDFGEVVVRGNVHALTQTVTREISFEPGHRFDADRLFRSQRLLLSTRLFRQVTVDPVRGRPEDFPLVDGRRRVPIEITVEEADRIRLDTSVGFGSWELLRGSLKTTFTDFGGHGRSLDATLGASFKGFRAGAGIEDPWLFGVRHLKGRVQASYEQEERPTFRYDRIGIEATVTKQVAHELVGSLGLSLDSTEVTHVTGDVPKEFENTTRLSSLILGLVRDARGPDIFRPERGSLLSGSLELAQGTVDSAGSGGASRDLGFFRVRLGAVQILPLGGRTGLVLRAGTGAIRSLHGEEEIPIQERFYLGGNQTVRSFTEDDLGPRIRRRHGRSDSPAGGEFYSVMNVELRFPVRGPLEGALFADGGNVVRDFEDASLDHYRFALGLGLRYLTPIGPVRIDAGVNPSPRSRDDRFAIFLAVGFPF